MKILDLKAIFQSSNFQIKPVFFAFTFMFSCSQPVPKIPKRIVCLVPSITEIIFALDRQEYLKGNTIYCDYPEPAKQIYKVGDFSNPSLERIANLKPEVVFATLPEQKMVIDRLQQLGIKVFVSQPKDIDGMLKEIREIGKALSAERKSDSLVNYLQSELDSITSIQSQVTSHKQTRVYLEISATPLMTVGNGSFINDVIRRAGGKNIFDDLSQEYPVIDQEEVIKRNPDVIFILHPLTKSAEVKKRLGWQKISALKNGKIYDDVNPDLLFRPGPRIIEGIKVLAQRISGS
jgi:iron complex transport system substrate-binding protein